MCEWVAHSNSRPENILFYTVGYLLSEGDLCWLTLRVSQNSG